MEAKHTPGPWKVDPQFPVFGVKPRVYAQDKLICEIGNAENYLDAIEEWEGNARIIAAAPDLLQALNAYVEADVGTTDPHLTIQEQDKRMEDALGLAIAAIAKATGS